MNSIDQPGMCETRNNVELPAQHYSGTPPSRARGNVQSLSYMEIEHGCTDLGKRASHPLIPQQLDGGDGTESLSKETTQILDQ
jgi:hypothetical protein